MRRNLTNKDMTLSESKKLLKTIKKLGFELKKRGDYFAVSSNNKDTTDIYNFNSNLKLQGL